MHTPLPDSWVERLMARIAIRYGSAWIRMWEGIDMAAVKADWAEELGGFQRSPDSLAYGLEHLPPDKPPTVQQFAAICNRAPTPGAPALPAPKADPAVVAKVLTAFKPASNGPYSWADRLRSREVACERLTGFQRQAWREVLKAHPEVST